jgi:VRR-NUC domain
VQGDGGGFPDLLLCRGSVLIAAELKTDKGQLTAEQEQWLEAFRAAGIPAFVWRPSQWDQIEAVLRGG